MVKSSLAYTTGTGKITTYLDWVQAPPPTAAVFVSFTMIGALMPPLLEGKTINLYRNDVKVQSGATDAAGNIAFTEKLTAIATYVYYMEFPGDTEYERSVSSKSTVTTVKNKTSLPWVTPPPSSIIINTAFTMKLQLKDEAGAGLAGKTVNLLRNAVNIKSGTTASDGTVSFTDTLTAPGSYNYQGEFLGNTIYEGCEPTIGSVFGLSNQNQTPDSRGKELIAILSLIGLIRVVALR